MIKLANKTIAFITATMLVACCSLTIISCALNKPHKEALNARQSNSVPIIDTVDYKKTYEALHKEGKYDELRKHLQIWEAKEPANPEMFIAYFNYYINRNSVSKIALDADTANAINAEAMLKDPSTGEITGYIYKPVRYNSEDVSMAVEYIDNGLSIAPNRLDMRLGKAYILDEIGNYKNSGDELYAALEASKDIDKWLWKNSEEFEGGKAAFLDTIQGNYWQWFDKKTEESLEQIKRCSEKQIELYPENAYAYNNLAGYYYIKEQKEKALEYFLQAELIAPTNCVILINIGKIYFGKKEKQKAKKYFEKAFNIGNGRDKEYARYFLKKL